MSHQEDSKANDAVISVNVNDFTKTRDNVSNGSFYFFFFFSGEGSSCLPPVCRPRPRVVSRWRDTTSPNLPSEILYGAINNRDHCLCQYMVACLHCQGHCLDYDPSPPIS